MLWDGAAAAAGTSTFTAVAPPAVKALEEDVLTLLAAASLGLARAVNLFSGPVRAPDSIIPQRAVFVLGSGGPAPEAYADGTATERRYSAVQVTIRSDPGKRADGWLLARQVRAALHHANVAGYVDIRAMQSEPIYVGPDEADRHLWSVNLEMWREV